MRTIRILPFSTLLIAATASCGASATLLRETDAGGDESSPGLSGSGSTGASGSNGGNGASGSASSGSSPTPASGSNSASGSSTGGGSGSAPGGTGTSGSASSGAGGPGADAGRGSCVHDSDCPGGEYCGYPISATCSAAGQCLPTPKGPVCQSVALGCGCDGTAVAVPCYGLAKAPVRHLGAC